MKRSKSTHCRGRTPVEYDSVVRAVSEIAKAMHVRGKQELSRQHLTSPQPTGDDWLALDQLTAPHFAQKKQNSSN